MTVDEIRAMVRLTTMADSGEITDAELLTWINECIHDVSMRHNWPWLESQTNLTTVAGTAAYNENDWASGRAVQEILFVIRSGDDEPLHPISYELAVAAYGDDFPSGTPTKFFWWREYIYLVPTPDSAETIKLRYIREPTALTGADDEPPWLSTFHHLVVDFVEGRVWQQQEDFVKAQVAFQKYFDRLDLMKRVYQDRINYGPWAMGAGRSTVTGRSEPFRSDWGRADVS